jgi:hypothetical protein
MLTVGTTPTSVGISTLTNNPLDLAEYHGDEDGGYILPYDQSYLYKRREDLGLEFDTIDILSDIPYFNSIKDKYMDTDSITTLGNYLTAISYKTAADLSYAAVDLNCIDPIASGIVSYLLDKADTNYITLNGYYKESDTSILYNSIELLVEYHPDIKTITCTLSIPSLDDTSVEGEDTYTKYYREADIEALIANPNRLTIVRNDITTALKELNSSYSFTR